MGKLITVVGNSGIGKTTFAKELCLAGGFTNALEQHIERPFQQLFSTDLHRYALPNQIDYLLLRTEQEAEIRRRQFTGVVDGGLDQDFYVYTRLFKQKDYLDAREFELCERMYRFCREALPPPDLTVWLQAPIEVIIERFSKRSRPLQIAQITDLEQIDTLLQEWMLIQPPDPLLCLDVSTEDLAYQASIARVLEIIDSYTGLDVDIKDIHG